MKIQSGDVLTNNNFIAMSTDTIEFGSCYIDLSLFDTALCLQAWLDIAIYAHNVFGLTWGDCRAAIDAHFAGQTLPLSAIYARGLCVEFDRGVFTDDEIDNLSLEEMHAKLGARV